MEVSAQLAPVQNKLETIAEDVAKIKGADGIAKNNLSKHAASSSPALTQFAVMDKSQFIGSIARIPETVAAAKNNGELVKISTLDAIQKRLANASINSPDSFKAALALIGYASFVREKSGLFPNAAKIRSETCKAFGIIGSPQKIHIYSTGDHIDGCILSLDGVSLTDAVVKNAIVKYQGGAVRLKNVHFINCLFDVSIPENPSQPAKHFTDLLLAKSVGEKPNFIATAG